jgi:hypothetical protein
MAKPRAAVIPVERIASRIYLIRGEKVMLDSDLAEMYGVETRTLVQAVKRNSDRFPDDFMFQFSEEELENWRSQIVMSNPAAKMGLRRRPYAFTELGVAMLSTVLRSKSAIQVNVAIMRTFVRLREILATHRDVARKVGEHDQQIAALFQAVQKLLASPDPPKKYPIGYVPAKDD